MKKGILFSAVVALATLLMTGCGSSTPAKTIENLKAGIDGEMNASAKYAAFSQKATEEGYPAIAALFEATSKAEAIHAKNYQDILAGFQVTYEPVIKEIVVGTTAENLKAGVDGETYEFDVMYPAFIQAATDEGSQSAVVAFNYASDAEKGHAVLYANVLDVLNMPVIEGAAAPVTTLASVYYVCPKCGNTYAGTASDICEFCMTPQADFVAINAVFPVVEEVAVK